MWEFLTEVMKSHGVVGILAVMAHGAAVYLYLEQRKQNKANADLTQKILEEKEKRLEDVKEGKEDYEDLSRDLKRSLDILIKVFKSQ